MNQYIAYFDLLGYKDFILNNSHKDVKNGTLHSILLYMDLALSGGKTYRTNDGGFKADLSNAIINCLNISDTIIFWTPDTTINSLTELLEVAFLFNIEAVVNVFPLRGALVYGEFETIPYDQKNALNTTYRINPIFGRGLIHAHLKAENLNWAGSVIDESVIQTIVDQGIDPDEFLDKYAIKYFVPYKKTIENVVPEFAFRLINGTLDEAAYILLKERIVQNFANDNKDSTNERAQTLLRNTINFLTVLKKKD